MARSERLMPTRPSMGHLFAACACAWATAFAVEALTWQSYVSGQDGLAGIPRLAVILALAGALLFALVWARLSHAQRRRLLGVLCLPCIGALCSLACSSLFWASWQLDGTILANALSGEGQVVELVGDPVEREYGSVSVAQWHSGTRTVSFRFVWPKGAEPLSAGHAVRLSGSLSLPKPDEGGRWNHQQGYVGTLSAKRADAVGYASGLRGAVCSFRDDSFSAIMQRAGGGDAAGLLAGVVLGNRTAYAASELEQDFRTTGLAHLMAVSGTHLAVVTALLTWVLSHTVLSRRARGAGTLCCLALYVALTGFAPSALRAFAMCACAVLAGILKRRGHIVSALSLCVLLFVCGDPPLAFSLGFQLSVLAVFGLVVLSPLVACWLCRIMPGRLEGLADSIAATLAATLVTLPLTVPVFAQFPLISPLATLLAAPFVTLALGLGIPAVLVRGLGCFLGPLLPVGDFLLDAALAVAGACAALVHALADVPGACVPIDSAGTLIGALFALAFVLLWAIWPLPKAAASRAFEGSWADSGGKARRLGLRAAVCAALLLPLALVLFEGLGGPATLERTLRPSFASDAQVVMVDVGQGDCMLVRDGKAAVLIDTGEDGPTLERGLARQGITHLDAVYITHKDADHCGALSALTGVVGVDHVFVHAELLNSPVMAGVLEDARWVTGGKGAEGVSVGSRTKVGRFTLTLIGPEHGGTSENDDSLVNLLEYDEDGDGSPEARGLLTGDAEEGATAPLAASIGHVDFLKVAHHGSRDGATAEELAELSPEVALIGVGADNTYGHPTGETLSLLERARAQVYRTDLDGDITLGFSGNRMSVKLQKDG